MYRHHHSFIPTCVLFLFALQSYIVKANTDPLELTISEPAAGLVGTEVTFTASPSGGAGGYSYQWTIDGTDKGTTASQSYTVPNDPKKVTVECTVTDEDDNESEPQQMDFYQFLVTVNAIAFNHDTSAHSEDALNIRESKTTGIAAPEYVSGGANKHSAYVRNMAPRVCARFTVQPTDMTSLKLKANSSGCLGNLNETQVQFQNGISQGDVTIAGADYTRFTASKNTPNMVYKDTFSWEWQVTAANGNTIDTASFGSTAGHTVYVVYAAPVAPWSTAANNTLNPWANVLDYACDWASGKANLADAVGVITIKAYTDFGKNYYGEDTHTVDNNCNLTSLLANNWADCRDMSAVVQLFANVVGVPNNDIKVRRIEGGFQTYPVQPMKLSWQSVWWTFHQVAWYNNSVYDACIRARQSGSYIPAGINLSDYEMDVRQLLSGSWVPQTPHTITIVQ